MVSNYCRVTFTLGSIILNVISISETTWVLMDTDTGRVNMGLFKLCTTADRCERCAFYSRGLRIAYSTPCSALAARPSHSMVLLWSERCLSELVFLPQGRLSCVHVHHLNPTCPDFWRVPSFLCSADVDGELKNIPNDLALVSRSRAATAMIVLTLLSSLLTLVYAAFSLGRKSTSLV